MVRALASLFTLATAQHAGTLNKNSLPHFSVGHCTSTGCTDNTKTRLSLDSNWRWTHQEGTSTNCYTDNEWKSKSGEVMCEAGHTKSCGEKCAVGAWSKDQWEKPYGVDVTDNGVKLGFVTQGPYSVNVGTRLFVTEDGKYKQFHLLGKEVSMVVDMSQAYCGLNGAIYFVEMDPDGDKGVDTNKAGAEYGTGYCDAQCPRDLKWIKGKANIKPEWVPNKKDPNHNIGEGGRGHCCAELDIWEANKFSTQTAMHPMDTTGQIVCEGLKECGSQKEGERNIGPTDRNGCFANPYAFGHHKFYGPGSDYKVNTNKPFAVITEFREKDGEFDGMYQYYMQDGKTIHPPDFGFGNDNVMNSDFCKKVLAADGADYFNAHGGMHQFSKSVKNGMTMVLSYWDDMESNMNWLDSGKRGPCDPSHGDPATLRQKHPDARFDVRHIRYGKIGTTHAATLATMQEIEEQVV